MLSIAHIHLAYKSLKYEFLTERELSAICSVLNSSLQDCVDRLADNSSEYKSTLMHTLLRRVLCEPYESAHGVDAGGWCP